MRTKLECSAFFSVPELWEYNKSTQNGVGPFSEIQSIHINPRQQQQHKLIIRISKENKPLCFRLIGQCLKLKT